METAQAALWIVVMLVVLAIAFDFMNGFHDAANSIATVVSTGVLKPHQAVAWAGAADARQQLPAAAAGVAFCMQDACLKRRQIPGTCRLLPPIRTLETNMKRLLLVAFVLLLAGEWLGWQRHLPINGAKTSIVILLTLGYSILLWFIYRRGMPGRALAYCCVALFIASMSIFLVS